MKKGKKEEVKGEVREEEKTEETEETGEITVISGRGEEENLSSKELKAKLKEIKDREKALKDSLKIAREKEKIEGKKEEKESYTRIDSLLSVIENLPETGLSLNSIAFDSNSLFVEKKGEGKNNLKESLYYAKPIVKVLAYFKVIEGKTEKDGEGKEVVFYTKIV
jgi:hypothetical protein